MYHFWNTARRPFVFEIRSPMSVTAAMLSNAVTVFVPCPPMRAPGVGARVGTQKGDGRLAGSLRAWSQDSPNFERRLERRGI